MSDAAYKMTTIAQPGEVAACIENIIGSAISQAVKEERKRVEGKPSKPPTASGYRKILEDDLDARGWAIQRKAAP